MIQSIHIKNFRSILDETIDFSFAEGKAPNGHADTPRMPFIQKPGTRFRGVPVLALFGANGAGKSNILIAVNAFRRQVLGIPPDLYQFFQPNKLHGPWIPTEIAWTFYTEGKHLRYLLENDGDRFIREELDADGEIVFSIQSYASNLAPLTTIAYPLEHLEAYLRVECGRTPDGSFMRPFLSVLGKNYPGLDSRTKAAFDFFKDGIETSITDQLDMGHFPVDVQHLAQTKKTDESTILAEIASLVRKLDVPIAGINIERTKDPLGLPPAPSFHQTWFLCPNPSGGPVPTHLTTIHRDESNSEVVFRLNEEESAGTQHLIYLLARLLLALERGATVFVDELDRSLHPLLVRSLLNLFVDRSLNKKGARLVFTTHCTDLLDNSILRLSEVAIVSNGLRTGTRVRRLTDLKKEGVPLRNVTDFRKNYLDGFYSGVPFPTL